MQLRRAWLLLFLTEPQSHSSSAQKRVSKSLPPTTETHKLPRAACTCCLSEVLFSSSLRENPHLPTALTSNTALIKGRLVIWVGWQLSAPKIPRRCYEQEQGNDDQISLKLGVIVWCPENRKQTKEWRSLTHFFILLTVLFHSVMNMMNMIRFHFVGH